MSANPVSSTLSIDLAAIKANIALLRNHLPRATRLMVMIKALAYGTDESVIAGFLEKECSIDIFGVATVQEGINLRKSGVTGAIFVMNALPQEAPWIGRYQLEVGVSEESLLQALVEAENPVAIHLHINTGMGRFGASPQKAVSLARFVGRSPYLKLAGLSTHFSSAEHPQEDPFTNRQAELFDQVIATLKEENLLPKWHHAANSSGAIRFSFPQYNMVRIGLAIYGLFASEASQGIIPLKPALTLTSQIVGITPCVCGDSIGYGRQYRVKEKSQRIGVLPIGYFDGLHRCYGGRAEVLIHGKRAPLVGSVCMDFTMVDLTHIPETQLGDTAILFGRDHFGNTLSAEELAQKGGTIPHELVTCLGPRIKRVFYDSHLKGEPNEPSTKRLHTPAYTGASYACATGDQLPN